MRSRTTILFLLLTFAALSLICVGPSVLSQSQTNETRGLAELQKGDYDNAFKSLSARLVSNPTDVVAQKALLRVYIETGRYAEAEATAKRFLTKTPDAGAVRYELGEVLAITGKHIEAIAEFERAAADAQKSDAPHDKLASDLRRAEVLDLIGQEEVAKPIYESFVKYYTDNDPASAFELTLIARALVHLERFQDANDMYRSAIEADSNYLDAQLGAAELFTGKYQYGDAAQFLEDALKINPNSARAQLDVALNKRIDGGDDAALGRALAINPNLVEGMALKAALALDAGQFEAATTEIDKALKVNPRSLEAHSLRAAMFYLQDKEFEPEAAATLAISPHYGGVYNTLSHYATITRRTEQAAAFARRAIQIAPRLWDAHLNLGMALLRLGQMDTGREEVEKAFKGDPFNLWAKNTLDLLDTMADFRETKRAGFIIKTSAQESDVLSPYAANLLEEAAAKLTAKYKFTPKGPIIVEIFPNHEDFAVRTLGIPGLGALGVCFGVVIVQDSPSARDAGEFNWGSTLWHEYTHVITLQMTDYRIPRWFSEGLSVYEERRARPGWGDDWNPMFVGSFMDKRWFKIADLDAAFQRPRSPQDVPIAYFEASQICEFISERFGFDAILQMLAAYREKGRTPDVLRQVLKLSEADFDREFFAYVESKARPLHQALSTQNNVVASMTKEEVLKQLETQDTFALRIRAAELLAADGDTAGAAQHYIRAIELFPYVTARGNPYESLAKMLEQKGDAAQAALILERLVKTDENNLEALKNVARIRSALGEKQKALDALRASFFISPFDYKLHTQAGELSTDLKDNAQALTEFQVALALEPPNIAEANYNVATAFHALGRQLEAKRSVLRALEAAPRYEKAQELLLRIVGQ
ncbi:MAG TPA: tetratricopeptide repeat protein [Pyrinomonadaceae bacterium]|jgi:tetratricopeptide (TPR) repeat protein|nr:tetratricopeptide repeat protein [Pyrinomonadaceae bacterium]